MTLVDLMNLFDTDAKCRELLVRLRWPNGPECIRCHGKVAELATAKQLFYCKECDYQFTVTAGTIFNDSHLALEKWFLATLLLCEARKGMSALQLKRTIWGQHKGSYKTAWYLCHRIRAAMREAEAPMLGGTVEIDETYVGGKIRNKPWNAKRYVSKHSKQVVIGIRQRSGELRFIHADDNRAKTVKEIINDHVGEDVDVIVTDESAIYHFALDKGQKRKHRTINHSKEYVRGDVHTNTVESAFSLLKRGIVGTWHRVSKKHLAAYLDEMTFRFNRRKNHDLFLDTLRHMVTADPLTFERLTA
jgi:transposase-like protein